MLLTEQARDLVNYISRLLDGRCVNIMNTEGIIIASTEKTRVGSFHKGALDAIKNDSPVCIYKEQVLNYPGAREGYNMPLRIDGTISGAVGIYGNPDNIRHLAHLVEIYAEKYFQLENLLSSQFSESFHRSSLLKKLIEPSDDDYSDASELLKMLNIHLTFPVISVVISANSSFFSVKDMTALERRLKLKALIKPDRDVWGLVEGRFVLITSNEAHTIGSIINQDNLNIFGEGNAFRLAMGEPVMNIRQIRSSYEQALILTSAASEQISSMEDLSSRCSYLMFRSASLAEDYLEDAIRKLKSIYTERECEILFESAAMYYSFNRSIGKASEKLFIHKNTLQHRLKKLTVGLALDNQNDFVREYIIRLLIEYLRNTNS